MQWMIYCTRHATNDIVHLQINDIPELIGTDDVNQRISLYTRVCRSRRSQEVCLLSPVKVL
jgi:hypothetical protein